QGKPCDYPVIENGALSGTLEYYRNRYFPAQIGQQADYHCRRGYSTPSGENWVRVVCSARGWLPEPKCLCSKSCNIEFDNGYFTMRKATFRLQEKTTYRCHINYVTAEGQETGLIQCEENGWTPPPKCIKPCRIPRYEILNYHTNKTVFLPGDTLEYACSDGYQTANNMTTGTARCDINGEWIPEPQCLDVSEKCGPPPAIENGDLLSFPLQEYAPGSTLEYKCPSLYVLEGSRYITCAEGQWTNPPVCLVACTASEEDMNRNNIELKWVARNKLYSKSGDFIEFECKIGHVQDPASSPFRAQCVEGKLEYPHCKPGSKSSPSRPLLLCCFVAFSLWQLRGKP
uniref:Sushi domain-containing protein n=1 Tax=Apteryx owenii TaxID=8824 RepID=A0A8B9Q310_APTOW